jgi:hypothetical protein
VSLEQDEIRTLVARLARPDASGSLVVERAAILAEGTASAAITDWILTHGGVRAAPAPSPERHGLHGSRLPGGGDRVSERAPHYLLPADALA